MNELREQFLKVDTTATCDADKTTRVLTSAIRPRSAQPHIFGPAFTVRCQDDFLAVLRAIESAAPGDVIVVDGGGRELALGGELFARGGDHILADPEGVIVVDPARLPELLGSAASIKAAEERLIQRLDAGGTLSDGINVAGHVAGHVAALGRGEPSALKFLD